MPINSRDLRTEAPDGIRLEGPRDQALGFHHRRPAVAIVMPAFNEELTVARTILAFHAAMPDAVIVVVDNASVDQTWEKARSVLTDLPCETRLIHEPRQGKGCAIRRAFHDVDAEVYVLVDADLTYPADRLQDLVAPIMDGKADMVVGNRLAGGRYAEEHKRRFHDVGNRLVVAIVNRLFQTDLGDIMSGYRALSRRFVRNYPILVDGFEIETDMTLHALDKRFRVVELPVEYARRPAGSSSKLRTFTDGRRVLSTIIQVMRYYKPLLFFGLLSMLSGVAGLVAAIPVVTDWIDHQYIYHVPLAILATGLELLAAMSLGIGLLLDSVVHHERLAYERDLLKDDSD